MASGYCTSVQLNFFFSFLGGFGLVQSKFQGEFPIGEGEWRIFLFFLIVSLTDY